MTNEELDAIEARAKAVPHAAWLTDEGAIFKWSRAAVPALVAEVRRLRKLFDDAGQGEHNVLALIDHYQDAALESDAEVRRLAADNARMRAGIAAMAKMRASHDDGCAFNCVCPPDDCPHGHAATKRVCDCTKADLAALLGGAS